MIYSKDGLYYNVSKQPSILSLFNPFISFLFRQMYFVACSYLFFYFILDYFLDGFDLFKAVSYVHLIYSLLTYRLQSRFLLKKGFKLN